MVVRRRVHRSFSLLDPRKGVGGPQTKQLQKRGMVADRRHPPERETGHLSLPTGFDVEVDEHLDVVHEEPDGEA